MIVVIKTSKTNCFSTPCTSNKCGCYATNIFTICSIIKVYIINI